MTETYAWADHRIFEAGTEPNGKALLFGTDHASLFALDGSTRDVLARWRGRESVDLREASSPDREILKALRDNFKVLLFLNELQLPIRESYLQQALL